MACFTDKRDEKQFSLTKTMKLSTGEDWCVMSSAHIYENDVLAIVNGTIIVRLNLSNGDYTEIEKYCLYLIRRQIFSLPEKPIAIGTCCTGIIAISKEGVCFKLDNEWKVQYTLPECSYYDIKDSQVNSIHLFAYLFIETYFNLH